MNKSFPLRVLLGSMLIPGMSQVSDNAFSELPAGKSHYLNGTANDRGGDLGSGQSVIGNLSVRPDQPALSGSESFAGGKGTTGDPYQVKTAIQLNEIRRYPGAYFIQTADIDLGEAPWNSGRGWAPLCSHPDSSFTGGFNGNGYKVRNLMINLPDSGNVGLFGKAVSADFMKITLENAVVKGKEYVGALAGLVIGGSHSQLNVTGSVTGLAYTGGLFGMVSGVTVTESVSGAKVSGCRITGGLAGWGKASGCKATGKVTGLTAGNDESSNIGGLLGQGYALNCEASGEVTGGSGIGGLIGMGSAQGCHATGNVTATGDYVGGLIGDLYAFDDNTGDGKEYLPGEAALPDTVKLKKTATSEAGKQVVITLEDGTRVLIPAFPASLQINLEKGDFDIPAEEVFADGSNFRTTGSMRHLVIRGNSDTLLIKPVVTIPAGDAGTIDVETINAVRIGSLYKNGEILENQTAFLPVTLDANGNFIFVDTFFPEGIIPESKKSASVSGGANYESGTGNEKDETYWVGDARYFLMSFDQCLNWRKRPVLERMIPDPTAFASGFRRPISTLSPSERKKLLQQPVCNVVFLVHGHNEEEKVGYVNKLVPSPWEFNYKRLVWEILYEEVSKNRNKDLPSGCTAFYEFIAPTYRPVYSPVLSKKTGVTYKTLGEDMGDLINREMNDNAQFKAMIDAGMPFNVFFLAHSQGGLSMRAGLRFVGTEVLKRIKLAATWGSPHLGAGLTSLRYALVAGHDLIIDGVRLPVAYIGQTNVYQSGVNGLAIDAPGTRDLRWDSSEKEMMRLEEIFTLDYETPAEVIDYEPPHGKMIYNENLRLFNEEEEKFTSQFLKDKYFFYEGQTSKIAPIEFGWDMRRLRKTYYFASASTGIEKGAFLNTLAMKPSWNKGDGAVPWNSARAGSIWPAGNIRYRSVGDVDHEEFYGSELPLRNDNTIAIGRTILGYTFEDMEMKTEPKSCPKLETESKERNDSLLITGKLVFPLYSKSNGGDDLPGKRMLSMEALRDNQVAVPALKFTFKEDGTFEGRGKKAEIPDDTLFVVATLKDGSLIAGKLERKIENMVHNKTRNLWYSAIQKAISEANTNDSILVYPGIYEEYLQINKNIYLLSKSGPEVTILDGKMSGTGLGIINASPHIKGFTIRRYWNGAIISQSSGTSTIKPVIENNRIINNDGKGIYIQWGKAAPQILKNIISSNKYYGIDFDKYYLEMGDAPALISGNTIADQNRGIRVDGDIHVEITGNTFSGNDYGIEMLGKSSATIFKDTIRSNISDGIRLYLVTDSTVISYCHFENNPFGVHGQSDARHTIKANTFTGNETAIYMSNNSGTTAESVITDNLVTNGSGTGISTRNSKITLKGNMVVNNKGGGLIAGGCSGEISGNTISGNSSDNGAGICLNYEKEGALTIRQNTISDNKATYDGGGIYIGTVNSTKIEGNKINRNFAGQKGGGISGTANGWVRTADVTVSGKTQTVLRHVPCFTETTNTYSDNSQGNKSGSWGPGVDKWCDDAGFNVYIH